MKSFHFEVSCSYPPEAAELFSELSKQLEGVAQENNFLNTIGLAFCAFTYKGEDAEVALRVWFSPLLASRKLASSASAHIELKEIREGRITAAETFNGV